MNPYDPPVPAIEPAIESAITSTATDAGPSRLWFAGTIAGSVFTAGLLYRLIRGLNIEAHYLDAFIFSIVYAAFCAIPSVVIYSLMRQILRDTLDFSSTKRSLLVSGVLTTAYLGMVYAVESNQSRFSETTIWLVGAVIGVAFSCIVIAIEMRVVGPEMRQTQSKALPGTAAKGAASVFWFSAGCLIGAVLIMLILDGLLGRGFIGTLNEIIYPASFLCLIGTVVYAALDACVKRDSGPTPLSRLTAGVVYSCLFGLVMEFFATRGPGGASIAALFLIAPLVSGAVSLATDRLIAKRNRSVASI